MPYLGGVAVFAGLVVGVCGRSADRPGPSGRRHGPRRQRRPLRPSGAFAAGGSAGSGSPYRATQPIHLPGWIGIPLVMAASVVLINGFNLLDGLDMLAAGVGGSGGRRLRYHHPWACSSHGGLSGRRSGRVPLVQPSTGPHLPGGRWLLPARGGDDRASRRTPGASASPLRTGVIALAMLAVPVASWRVPSSTTSTQRPLPYGRRPRPSVRPSGGARLVPHRSQWRLHRR